MLVRCGPTHVLDVAIFSLAPFFSSLIIGILPGEKLHEIMITQDDAINTAEFETHYTIQPAADWWNRPNCIDETGGKPVSESFHYSSNANPVWMTHEQLARS